MAKGNTLAFTANIMNMFLATGVFTLPFSMWETGFYLGCIVLLIISVFSFLTATFIIESIAIANALYKEEREIFKKILDVTSESNFSEGNDKSKSLRFLRNTYQSQKTDIINTDETMKSTDKIEISDNKDNEQNQSSEQNEMDDEKKDSYYIVKRFEFLKLAKIFDKPIYFMVLLIFFGYLFISLTSNAVLMGNSLENIIIKTFGLNANNFTYLYYIIVSMFYFIVILISLNNIEQLKKLTSVIMIGRIIVILLIIGSCIYTIVDYGALEIKNFPTFNFSNVTLMIGNTLFFFMIHHSIPGMIEGFSPQKNLITILFLGFFASFIFFIIYGLITFMAFGKYTKCDYSENYPTAIMNLFNLNFIHFNAIGYIINYYPILNIITGSIQLITLKNNFVCVFDGCCEDFQSKYDVIREVRVFNLGKNLGGHNEKYRWNFPYCITQLYYGFSYKRSSGYYEILYFCFWIFLNFDNSDVTCLHI